MGQLYDHNGRGITNIPLLSFENGEVTRYGQSIKDIKMRYDNNYIYIYPRTSFDTPVASFQEDNGVWYIYNYPKGIFDTSIGYLENGRIYKYPTSLVREPIGYYEGSDMPGACSAAYCAFFSSNSNSTSANSKAETSTNQTSNSSAGNNTNNSSSNGDGIGLLLSPLVIFFIWLFFKYMAYILALTSSALFIFTIYFLITMIIDAKKEKFSYSILSIIISIIGGIVAFFVYPYIIGIPMIFLNFWRNFTPIDALSWFSIEGEPHVYTSSALLAISTSVYILSGIDCKLDERKKKKEEKNSSDKTSETNICKIKEYYEFFGIDKNKK